MGPTVCRQLPTTPDEPPGCKPKLHFGESDGFDFPPKDTGYNVRYVLFRLPMPAVYRFPCHAKLNFSVMKHTQTSSKTSYKNSVLLQCIFHLHVPICSRCSPDRNPVRTQMLFMVVSSAVRFATTVRASLTAIPRH